MFVKSPFVLVPIICNALSFELINVLSHLKYDSPPLGTAVSVSKDVCGAHSRAFYLLAQMSGLPCHIVNRHAGGAEHSWNLVQMENGEWYHLTMKKNSARK